jgi:hypothetical protein
VLGNLNARNIAVGGQMFYVAGNLMASEILCGSYDHGEMYVGGDARAQFILSDDEYFFKFAGKVTGQIMDTLEEDDLVKLTKLFDESVFEDEDDDLSFNFSTLQELLVAGKPVMLRGVTG